MKPYHFSLFFLLPLLSSLSFLYCFHFCLCSLLAHTHIHPASVFVIHCSLILSIRYIVDILLCIQLLPNVTAFTFLIFVSVDKFDFSFALALSFHIYLYLMIPSSQLSFICLLYALYRSFLEFSVSGRTGVCVVSSFSSV